MLITTGKILAAHGMKGEVKVKPATDNPRRFIRGGRLLLDDGASELNIERVRQDKNDIRIIKFKEWSDRTVAEAARGKLLCVREEDAPKLPDGEFYLFQLEGMAVYEDNEDNTFLGTIRQVIQNGTNDVYAVEDEDGKGLLIPGLKQVVKTVDTENKKMMVSLPAGLKEACSYDC